MKKYWIIGSSSGIGKELAKKLDAKGCDLILSSRNEESLNQLNKSCLLYTSPSPRDGLLSRMPSSA